MRISAVIPAYNCAPYLKRAVDSLMATGYADLEIVVVDDGSRDGTWDVARKLTELYKGRVFAHHHPGHTNCGVSATRNLGIDRSTGELACFLDADDFVYPTRFDFAARVLRDKPNVDGVHEVSDVVFADSKAEKQWFKDATLFGFTKVIPADDLLFELLNGMCWATSAILFRRSLLQRTGVFDPRLRIAEDCHLWMRMATVGTLVGGDGKRPVSVYWRRADSAYRPSHYQRLHMMRAMASFLGWMRRRDANDYRLPEVIRRVEDYAINAVVQARMRREIRCAWRMALGSLWWLPRIVRRRQFVGNLARMMSGK